MQKLIGLSGAFVGREVFLNDFQIIGRNPSCHIVIEDPAVSRDQCKITRQNGVCQIVASDAASVLLVNGHQTQGAVLRHLDTITVGRTSLQFIDLSLAVQNSNHSIQPTQPSTPTYAPQQAPGPANISDPHPVGPGNFVQQGNGAQVGQGGSFNSVNVQVKNDSTALWVLLAVVFACPLMCIGLMALAMLPYTMLFVGSLIALWGYVDYTKCYRNNWMIPGSVMARLYGGAAVAGLGLLWIIAVLVTSGTPNARTSGIYDGSYSRRVS